MTLVDRVKQDLTSAMKAGEKDRVAALRLVLSELQKAVKEGGDDEVAVLRRERKRRQESASAFRDGNLVNQVNAGLWGLLRAHGAPKADLKPLG